MNVEQLIENVKEKALNKEAINKEEIISLLEMDPYSQAVERLGESARLIAKKVVGNKGKVWASIGVDYQPCSMNCNFCSFGEKWVSTKEQYTWSDDEVMHFANKLPRTVLHGLL